MLTRSLPATFGSRRRSLRIPAFLALVALAACVTTGTPAVETGTAAPKPEWTEPQDTADRVRLTIVGTNDLHGYLEAKDRASFTSGDAVLGGIDIFGGYVDIARRKRPDGVVLLDAGDIFQGTLVVNLTEGEAVITAYNLLGYDASAIGNHEFDYGPVGEPVIALTDADDPVGNLKKRIAQARFPFLAGNVFDKATGKPIAWENVRRSTLIERKGVRIGIIGLSTPLTPLVTLGQNVEKLEFRALKETTEELAKDLRERGAQVVLLTLHAGTGCTYDDPKDEGGCDPKGELYKLLHELPSGTIDAAVAGHTHQRLSHFINGVPAIQSGSFGEAFGMIELVYDKAGKAVVPAETKIWKPVPLCRKLYAKTGDCKGDVDSPLAPAYFLGEEVVPSPALQEAMRPIFRKVQARKEEQLGPVLLSGYGKSRTEESQLGDLVTDVMKESIDGAAIALTNSGGIRAELPAGKLTYGQVFNVLPFENRLAVVELKGSDLLELLAHGVSGQHGIVQVSGVKLEVAKLGQSETSCLPGGARLISAVLEDGSPIEPEETYKVVTNDFLAGGGDGYGKVLNRLPPSQLRIRNDLPPLRELVAAWFRTHPEVKGPPEQSPGRITFTRPACMTPATP